MKISGPREELIHFLIDIAHQLAIHPELDEVKKTSPTGLIEINFVVTPSHEITWEAKEPT